jgi:hypothetical protein
MNANNGIINQPSSYSVLGVVPTPGYNLMGLSKEQVQGFVAS